MRKSSSIISMVAAVLAVLPACNKAAEDSFSYATAVVLNKDNLEMQVGQTASLTAKVMPESFSQAVIWSSLDTSLVKVSDGVVTSCNTGVTYVVATSSDGYALASCMVSVNPPKLYDIIIKNQQGEEINSVYSYPGYSSQLSVSTSDGLQHDFTWESTNPDAFTVDEGLLKLNYLSSSEPDWLYYGAGNLVLRSEDGYGRSIPIVSSICRSIWFDSEFKAMGSYFAIDKNSQHTVAPCYYDGELTGILPMTQYKLSSSDTDNYTLSAEELEYKLTTADKDGTKTTLTMELPNGASIAAATVAVEKNYGIRATLQTAGTSTLVFNWTEGVSITEDVDKPYTATLYSDPDCRNVVRSYNFPTGNSCWSSKSPIFVFTKLTPGTKYYFRVLDTTESDPKESAVIEASTLPFAIVTMPATISGTGVVLSEDFGELGWYDDLVSQGAGVSTPSDDSSFKNEGSDFINYHKTGEPVLFTKSSALAESRLDGWANGKSNQCYVHAGQIKFGTSSAKNWLFTPAFPVQAGKTAVLRVVATVSSYAANETSKLAIGVLTATPSSHRISTFTMPSEQGKYGEVTLNSAISWKTVELTGLEIQAGERLVIGPTSSAAAKSRWILDDIYVEVTQIK